MKTTFSVKNWSEFQHYKDRNPPWIKLHNHLLDDYEFECLGDAAKGHLLCIWMLASRTKNEMPFDEKWITKKIGASSKVNLQALVDSGFLIVERDASKVLHKEKQDATASVPSVEERRGREETEERREDHSVSDRKLSQDDINFAEWFFTKLKKLNPKQKRPTKSAFDKWADCVRLIRVADGRTYQEMSDLFIWVNSNDFWKGNILSPVKLRKHWDMLVIQMNKEANKPIKIDATEQSAQSNWHEEDLGL